MTVRILIGDVRRRLSDLPDGSVHCIVTSPPYWGLRAYLGDDDPLKPFELGLETTPAEYVANMVAVFAEARRVLRADGTLWLNLGDSYATNAGAVGRAPGGGAQGARFIRAGMINTQPNRMPLPGLKSKDLVGIPWRVAFALQADGWWLRQDIIWAKPNPMPESVTDRCTKAHEYLFLLSKSATYYYDADSIKEPIRGDAGSPFTEGKTAAHQLGRARGRPNGAATYDKFGHNSSCGTPQDGLRNKRSVWTVTTQPFSEAHFATFPPALIEPCILAGCPEGGTVLDPFGGAGTTGLVADRLERNAILIELNPAYGDMAERRIRNDGGMLTDVSISLG